jgi:hypothetical protein
MTTLQISPTKQIKTHVDDRWLIGNVIMQMNFPMLNPNFQRTAPYRLQCLQVCRVTWIVVWTRLSYYLKKQFYRLIVTLPVNIIVRPNPKLLSRFVWLAASYAIRRLVFKPGSSKSCHLYVTVFPLVRAPKSFTP